MNKTSPLVFERLRTPAWSPVTRLALLLAAGGALWASALPVAAEPAQVPLTSRSAPPPQPNVMVTIDDSGSMLFDFMPEETFKVNGYSVKIAQSVDPFGAGKVYWPLGFYGDPRRVVSYGGYNYTYETGTVTAVKSGETVFQKQFRSPDVNSLYYNPDLYYRPWIDPANMPNDKAKATPSAAKWDPNLAGTFNLTNTISYNGNTVYWCTAYNNCATSYNSVNFYPGLVYRLKSGSVDPNQSGSYTRYDINGQNGDPFSPATKHPNRIDCAGSKCTKAEEQQNFANWFTYYRKRESMFKAAIGRSLADFQDKVRVGWARYHPENTGAIDSTRNVQQIVKPMNAAYLSSVLTNIYNLQSFNGTPTRSVMDATGDFFKKAPSDSESPWLSVPGTSGSGVLECRRSVQLLMTDGYYNDTYSNAGDRDGVAGTNYDGANNPNSYSPTQYIPARPYTDAPASRSDTLADVAMKYFKEDLQTGMANKVPPVDGDIAYWQHLTQFMVGLGVTGTLDSSTPAAKLDTINKIKNGTLNWPDPSPAANSAEKIDDMWHAAVNTGGDFYSVRNVAELSTALSDAIGRAAGAESKEGGVAVAAKSLVAGNLKLVPKYKSSSWVGDLEAFALDEKGNASETPTWIASSKVPAPASRNLVTWSGTAPVMFTWAAMGAANQTLVGSQDLTNYVRGDTTKEGVGNPYRSRGGAKLGDFVNSPPVYVKGLVDLEYDVIDTGYRSFVEAKQARSNAVIFQGGNAGILHAFRGNDGTEVFGYLPQAGLGQLNILAKKDYGTPSNFHRFFVDGPMVETDAKIVTRRSGSASWANLVVGSMGAGGTGFFALHVPTATPTVLDEKTLLWEKSAADDSSIGYIVSEIAVGKIKGGGWKAFVGNGVDSVGGTAALLVVDLATGAIDKKITVGASGANGLMGVTLLKDATTKEAVGAYAGDLQGNLWRFDFEGASPSDWKVGFGDEPLFRAVVDGLAQPITVAPTFVPSSDGPGRIVLFGTGKLLSTSDADSLQRHSFYGVLDPTQEGSSSVNTTSPFDAVSDDRELLEVRTASTEAKTEKGRSYYEITGKAVDWNTQKGWYMDLPFDRQRDIYPTLILFGDYVFIQTMVPAASAADCETSAGTGYNYVLVATDGAPLTVPIFDTNGDGKVDKDDMIAGGFETKADGKDEVICDKETRRCVDESTGDPLTIEFPPKTWRLRDC